MKIDEFYMDRCLQLAKNGCKNAVPNPMVGAVIVCDGKIIGEGYHVRCGEAHAEVNAIQSVKDKTKLKDSTLYVSLEPCSHYGKTPPCADLIVKMGIPRVVVGCIDPFAKVAGRGIQILRDADIDVTVGIRASECRQLNRKFFTYHLRKRPFITLKWAETADGFIDNRSRFAQPASSDPLRISTAETMPLVHKLRGEHQAILVGSRTALLDNPRLSNRLWSGEQPLRIVIDRQMMLPSSLNLFDGTQPTLCVVDEMKIDTPQANQLRAQGVTLLGVNPEVSPLPSLMDYLYNAGCQSLLVEGGAQTHQNFINEGLWDEIRVERGTIFAGKGIPAANIPTGFNYQEENHFGHAFHVYSRKI